MSEAWAGVLRRVGVSSPGALARELKAPGLYLAVAVVAGQALGALRALVLVPRHGAGAAWALDTPWAAAAVLLGACYLVQRALLRAVPARGLGGGFAALALILAVEVIAVLRP